MGGGGGGGVPNKFPAHIKMEVINLYMEAMTTWYKTFYIKIKNKKSILVLVLQEKSAIV